MCIMGQLGTSMLWQTSVVLAHRVLCDSVGLSSQMQDIHSLRRERGEEEGREGGRAGGEEKKRERERA